MASGTVDKRFLTKSAKAASARVLLALAVAALLLTGCGGGSSSDTSSPTAAADGAAAEADPGAGNGPGDGGGFGSSGAHSATAASGASGSGGSGEQPSSGGRHGPPVPQPTGAPAPEITPKQRREATVADISLQSPSIPPSTSGPQALPAHYTCDGKNISPALSWRGVPQGTAELVLFAMNLRPVEEGLFFDWAVAGLNPDLGEIQAGQLPKGAVVGRNSFGKTGYEICPEGGSETYLFTLFALPKKLSPSQGFEPQALRKAVLDISGNVGLLALSYQRG